MSAIQRAIEAGQRSRLVLSRKGHFKAGILGMHGARHQHHVALAQIETRRGSRGRLRRDRQLFSHSKSPNWL
jgi:hypothetical protein